jgi:glutamyl-tRNA synthetase
MTENRQVRVRMAPSPTGFFHLGSARTALFNWLYARHTGGKFILRIEDTDQKRYSPKALQDFMESLRWLGLDWDEGPEVGGPHEPYFQSQRLPIYHEYADWLVDHSYAYRCYCSAERLESVRAEQSAQKLEVTGYDRHCRYLTRAQRAELESSGLPFVVRFAMPIDGETEFTDLLRTTHPVANSQVLDPVLLKSDGFPTYHLANVVDDHLMAITHILRGDEWLSSLPLHVNLYHAFGWEIPVYAHLPLILDPSGHGKLSKRKKRSEDGPELLTFVHEYRQAGYLSEAMFNFLAILGWSYSADTDLFTRQQAIDAFELHNINPSPGALPLSKLEWMNGHYIRALAPEELAERLIPFLAKSVGLPEDALRTHPALPIIAPLVQPRIKTLADAGALVDFVFAEDIDYDGAMLVAKGLDAALSLSALEAATRKIAELPFEESALEPALRALAEELGLKAAQLFGIIRIATTGKAVAPPLFGSLMALGRERTLARLSAAARRLQGVIRA